MGRVDENGQDGRGGQGGMLRHRLDQIGSFPAASIVTRRSRLVKRLSTILWRGLRPGFLSAASDFPQDAKK